MAGDGEGLLEALFGAAGEDGDAFAGGFHFLEVAVAMEGDVAPGVDGGAGAGEDGSGQGFHGKVVAHEEAAKADFAADDVDNHAGRRGGRGVGVDCRIDDVGGHGGRHVGQFAERGEVGPAEFGVACFDDRQVEVAVGGRAAVAGDVLDDRDDAASDMAARDGFGKGYDLGHGGTVGAVADDVVAAGDGQVEDRRAVAVDRQGAQFGGDEAGGVEGGAAGLDGVGGVEGGVVRGRGQCAGERGTQALDAAAFLVDQDEDFGGGEGFEDGGDQRADLGGAVAVAGEQDDAARAFAAQERRFVDGEFGAREAGDEGAMVAHGRLLLVGRQSGGGGSFPSPVTGEGAPKGRMRTWISCGQ